MDVFQTVVTRFRKEPPATGSQRRAYDRGYHDLVKPDVHRASSEAAAYRAGVLDRESEKRRDTRAEFERFVLFVECARCGAAPGVRCTSAKGRPQGVPIGNSHHIRYHGRSWPEWIRSTDG